MRRVTSRTSRPVNTRDSPQDRRDAAIAKNATNATAPRGVRGTRASGASVEGALSIWPAAVSGSPRPGGSLRPCADCITMRRVEKLHESLLHLVVETSSNLPPDVRRAMARALRTEDPDTRASQAL